MKFSQRDLIVLETAAINYQAFWEEWTIRINDGSCSPEHVKRNITEFSQLVKRIRLEEK